MMKNSAFMSEGKKTAKEDIIFIDEYTLTEDELKNISKEEPEDGASKE